MRQPGSKYDSNSNVTDKNIAVMSWEVPKKDNIDLNREMMRLKLTELYGEEFAAQYQKDLDSHIIYKHDETSLIPDYCASVSMMPFLLDGCKSLGGSSSAPMHLDSYCGGFINLLFILASQHAGAIATVEFLMYFDHFVRKDYGDDYYLHADEKFKIGNTETSIREIIYKHFAQVVYSVNQPCAARGAQAVFWNISYFDKYYFESLFKDFVFPDFDTPRWESTSWLQKTFMKWFNAERLKEVLTFPVETMNLLDDGNDILDQEYKDFTAEMWAEGHSFFCYRSDSVDALASCCRLKNAITEDMKDNGKNEFSYTLAGGGAVQTGSKGVITINFNRLIQTWFEQNPGKELEEYYEYVKEIVERVHKYLTAFNEIVNDYEKSGLLPVYKAGYNNINKKYLTIGIQGFIESAEFIKKFILPDSDMAIRPDSKTYAEYANKLCKTIADLNKAARTEKCRFNTEFVPGESLGVKNAKWDKEDGLYVPRDVYNSYFYIVEDEGTSVIDKIRLHGMNFTGNLDGGSAAHLNLDHYLTKEQYKKILEIAVKEGCPYFTFNVLQGVCEDCGYISKDAFDVCPKCGSKHVSALTRVIGYLRKISNFSEARQKEAAKRVYNKDIGKE